MPRARPSRLGLLAFQKAIGFVVVGQAADVIGVRPVMAACGPVGMVLTAGVLLLPGTRDPRDASR